MKKHLFDKKLIILFSSLFVASSIMSFQNVDAKVNAVDTLEEKEDGHTFCSQSSKVIIACEDPERVSDENVLTYHFNSRAAIKDVKVTGNVTLIDSSIELEKFAITVKVLEKECEANIQVETVEGTCYYSLFFCKNNGAYYSSNLSMDTAKYKAGVPLSYELTESNREDSEPRDPNIRRGIGTSGTVGGAIWWTDDDGNSFPLLGAKVKLTIAGALWYSSTVYTDDIGMFDFTYNDIWYVGTGKPSITIYTETENISVKNSNSNTYSYTYNFNSVGGNHTFIKNFTIAENGDFTKALQILQAGYYYSEFAKSLNNGNSISDCQILFPYSSAFEGTSYSNNTIYLEPDSVAIPGHPKVHAAWDVIGHEYGHHIEHYFGFSFYGASYNHEVKTNGIDHLYQTSQVYTLSDSKNAALKVAMLEGLATFLGIYAQSTFPSDIRTSIATVGDTLYTPFNDQDDDIDAYDCAYGDSSETVVACILYKLVSPETDDYDRFHISINTLWNIIKQNPQSPRFDLFINRLYQNIYDKQNIAKLLEAYGVIGSTLERTGGDYVDVRPTFTWSAFMGSQLMRYNEFDLVFLNANKTLIFKKEHIQTSGLVNVSYTLTEFEWVTLTGGLGSRYYVYFVARETTNFVSGNYESRHFSFDKPTDFLNKPQIKANEWGFEPQYFFETNKWKQTSIPVTDHGLTITHDRLRCGYIENSYVVLSPRRQNAGLAYLTMSFDIPVYSYLFSTALWSSNEGLSASDSTAVIEVMDEYGNWAEDFDLLNDVNLPIRTQNFYRCAVYHHEGIYGLRFVLTSQAVGNNNKGRLCLDDFVFSIDPNDMYFTNTNY